MTTNRRRRGGLLNTAKITPLDGNQIYKGNIVLTKVNIEDRKGKGSTVIPKMIFCTFTQVDPETRKRIAEVEVSWWKLKTTAKNKRGESMFFPSLRELLKQLVNILSCYMDYEKACEVMDNVFKDFEFSDNHEDVENFKWKTKTAKDLTVAIKETFFEAVSPFIGTGGDLLNLKLVSDESGDRAELPRYDKFVELHDEDEESELKFSTAETANMKKGNTEDAD